LASTTVPTSWLPGSETTTMAKIPDPVDGAGP